MDDAIKEYRKVIELSPDYSWAYFNLGQIYFAKQDFENAVIMLNMTIQKNKKDKEAYKLLCQLYLKLNDIDMALDVMDEMKEEAGVNGDYYYLMAEISKLKKDLVKYKDYLESAVANEETLTFNKKSVLGEFKEINSAK